MKKIIFILFLCLSTAPFHLHAQDDVPLAAQEKFKEALEQNALGDYPTALSRYIEAHTISPLILGYDDEGLLRNARDFFENHLNNNPRNINTIFWLASLSVLEGKVKEAIEHYQNIVMFAPQTKEAREADREIIRLEDILRVQQQRRELEMMQKQQESENLDRIKMNVTREVEERFISRIQDLEKTIEDLQRSNAQLRQDAEKAAKEVTEFQKKYSELEEENALNRKRYLRYRRYSREGED